MALAQEPKVEYHQDRGRWEVELEGELPPTELFHIENWLQQSYYVFALSFCASEQNKHNHSLFQKNVGMLNQAGPVTHVLNSLIALVCVCV